MFNKILVISIVRGKLLAVEVYKGRPLGKKLGIPFELGWENETLDLALSEITKKFRGKSCRILIGDNLSYVVRLSIPAEISREKQREYIKNALSEKIPEQLIEAEWDYKEINLKKDGDTEAREVVAFAVVADFFEVLTRAVQKVGLTVDAVEPEAISKTRNANPIVGLAIKEDITGKDENTLNLSLNISQEDAEKIPSEAEGIKHKPGILKKIVMLLIIIALIGVIIFIAKNYLLTNKVNEPESLPTQTPNATEAPSPTPEAVDDLSQYNIQVLNGSGTAGEADIVANILEGIEFSTIETSNASSFDYIDTAIQQKESVPKGVANLIKDALNDNYSAVILDEFLDSENPFDIVIIVGEKN